MKKTLLAILFFSLSTSQCLAATLYAKSAGGNYNAAGTWSNVNAAGVDSSGPPTAADDVIFELASGNVTITATAACRSLDTTSGTGTYGGTLTHNSTFILSIGDATAGAGNVALKLNSGMTYTRGSTLTSGITFKSTSATQQTITTGGKTFSNTVINGAGSSYQMLDAINTTGSFTYTAGTTFDTNGQTITLSGAAGTFAGGSKTYFELDLIGSGTQTVTGTNTFTNFNRTGTAVKTDVLSLGGNQTVTGVFTLAGNSSVNRLLVQSSVLGTSRTITNTGATHTWSNVDLKDTALGTLFDASAITGLSGDCDGNSNITFTTGATQYYYRNTGSWSDSTKWFLATNGGGGAGRVPLPQDDIIFNSTSMNTNTQTVTQDMPRMGMSINFTGMTNAPTINMNSVAQTIYGGLTTISSMTVTSGQNLTFEGRGAYNLTLGSINHFASSNLIVQAVGGSVTAQTNISPFTLALNNGTFDANNKNITMATFASTGTATRVINMGSGTWTLTGSGQVWGMAGVTSGVTVNSGTSLTVITASGASAVYHAGGNNYTYYNIQWTNAGGGANVRSVDSPNIFNNLIMIPGQVFAMLDNAGPVTVNGEVTSRGTAAQPIIWQTNIASVGMSKSSGYVICDYCTITNITGTGGAKFWAFRSTNGGGNTGWKFRKRVSVS